MNIEKNGFDLLIEKILRYSYFIIFGIVIIVYFQSLFFGLVNCDDHDIIISNYHLIENLDNWDSEIFRSYMNSDYYRPVINLSFMLNAQFAGQEPFFYHLINLLLHCLVACLTFYFLKKLDFNPYLSLIAAIVFAVHPLFVNAVVWIPGRNDIIFALFSLLSIIALIKHRESSKIIFLCLHAATLLLAVLSKETALLLPLIFISYLILIKRDSIFTKSNYMLYISWVVIIGIWLTMRANATLGNSFNEFGLNTFFTNISSLTEYFGKFIFPVNISVLPTFNIVNNAIGVCLFAFTIAFLVTNRHINIKMKLFASLWFLLLTVPGMFVRRLNAHDWNDYLECRAYLPSIGILILILILIPQGLIEKRKKEIIAIASFIIIIFSIITIVESRNYKDAFNFYQSAVIDNPDRAQFQYQFAKVCIGEDKPKIAEKALKASIKANPKYAKYFYVKFQAIFSIYAIFF